ncbi:Fur family transcriptional regulator [Okibacterium endophyticum]
MDTTARHPETREADSASLRESGLKVTAPRLHVLSALRVHPHATADDVFTSVISALPDTSVQTVYGVLGALTDAGLLRRIEPAGSPARYERRTGDNHHHIVCTRCGDVADVDCAIGRAPCLSPSATGGFTVVTAEVTYWGLCPVCADAGDPSAG